MGKAIGWIAGVAALLAASGAPAHEGHGTQNRADPRIVEGSLEVVGTGYTFTEGPAWDGARLIFSDIPGDTVHAYTPGEGAPKVLYTPSMMANGHSFDGAGRLLNAEHGSGALTRWTPGGGRQVIVEAYEGKHLNSPNDVVVRSDGLIVFTDPPYGLQGGYKGEKRADELGFSGVFALDEASGRMVLIDGTLERPNGAAFSPDERTLYVTDSATQKVWAYTIAADGSGSRKRQVIDVTDESKPGRVDGIRVDKEGLVYVTCPGGICVVDPKMGTVIDRLATPKRATNLAWGGPELSDLYITALGDVYRVKTRARGTGSSSRRAAER